MTQEFWSITVAVEIGNNMPILMRKNDTVADLYKKVRAASRVEISDYFTFYNFDATIELKENDQRRIADVDYITDKCTVHMVMVLTGGVWPTKAEVQEQIRNPIGRTSLAERITTDLPDMLYLDEVTPRVKMLCGHVIAPTSLAIYCYNELTKGKTAICCPGRDCNAEWPFVSIIDAACLSPNEAKEFERRIISNKLTGPGKVIKNCPGCQNFCRRLNENDKRIRCWKCTSANGEYFDFCWSCRKKWINSGKTVCGNLKCEDYASFFECLAKCKLIKLDGIKDIECPSIRACPKCLMLIEYLKKCKHFTCPIISCKYEFCFICLESYPCKTGYNKPCKLAPRQQPESFTSHPALVPVRAPASTLLPPPPRPHPSPTPPRPPPPRPPPPPPPDSNCAIL